LVILELSALGGAAVLNLFGISLDAFSVAGGGVLVWMGFSMLRGTTAPAGDTLRYDVTVIEGRDQVEGGPTSLFVDVIGMPLTPVSAAGVGRRTVRRVAFR
jgi:small neutral amino acid transporter SnatA (MarC family)